jgi:hypothetical protein
LKKLYTATSLPDAHLMRNLLEQAGISAHVFNENAQGGVGHLPVMEAYPQVWVVNDQDADRAREVVRAFEQMPAVSSTIRCTKCSEENPTTFQICWNCGAVLA